MSKYILALDQGTTSSRALLIDRFGSVCGIAQREIQQYFPHPGWVEHDPNEIWQSQLAVARDLLCDTKVRPQEIIGIGIANQRETTVLWDRRTGEPLANAIVWQDRRTSAACDALIAEGKSELIRSRTGLMIDAYFSASKLHWLLEHIPGARVLAEKGELAFGTVDSWLVFKLTGRHVTDASNASRTLLFNIHTLKWDSDLLDLFQIPRALLAEVVPSSGIVGNCKGELFGAPILIAALAGDQQAAAFGQVCHSEGMAKNTYGTGCFMLMNTGQLPISSQSGLLSTVGWQLPESTYMLEGSVYMAGAIVQWLRDNLNFISSSNEIEDLAASVPNSGGVIFVPAFTGLGAPHWDPHARALMIGMTRGTQRGHIARAAIESIALQSADLLSAMQSDSGVHLKELRVDGGAARNDMLMQYQADILNVDVLRPRVTETTALGVAFLAGLALKFWDSSEELAGFWVAERSFRPKMSSDMREGILSKWREAVGRAKDWAD